MSDNWTTEDDLRDIFDNFSDDRLPFEDDEDDWPDEDDYLAYNRKEDCYDYSDYPF